MGAISFSLDEKLLEYLAGALPVQHFVETGAFHGDTLALARRFFPNCRSVEMSPELFAQVKERFEGEAGVQVSLGDSPSLLRRWQGELVSVPVFFWLDAHWCQAEQTAGQTSQSPLLGELAAVGRLHAESVILIDDARYYLSPPPKPHQWKDWPDFQSVVSALVALSPHHRLLVFNDVILFYPERIKPALLEFAHRYGVDWLQVCHDSGELRSIQAREKERRARRFPSPQFFRYYWRKHVKKAQHDVAH